MTREKIGTVKEYNEEKSKIKVHLTESLSEHDEIAVLGPVAYQSQEVDKITKDGKEVEEAEENDDVEISTDTQVREGTSVYRMK